MRWLPVFRSDLSLLLRNWRNEKISKGKVLLLHQLIAEETGGSVGVRDEGLLESALETAFSSFGGQEFYPTKEEKVPGWDIT